MTRRQLSRPSARSRTALISALLTAAAVLALTTAPASGGFVAKIANSTNSVGSASTFVCSTALGADTSTALFQWPLADATTTTTAADISGTGNTGTYQGTRTIDSSASPACPRDGGTAWSLDGSTNYADFPTQQTNPTTFTLEIWFKTTTAAGLLIGFGDKATGASSNYDRHLYITTSGGVTFGLYNGSRLTITSPTTGYNDGKWHYAAATVSSAGSKLYVDGKQAATSTTMTTPENFNGYWRIGDNLISGWAGAGNQFFKGSLRYAAVYTSALTATQIANHFGAGSGT